MKSKDTLFFIAITLFLFSCCQKAEIYVETERTQSFIASIEKFGIATKTSMAPERYVVWSKNDRIAIFQGNSIAGEYIIDNKSVGNSSADFHAIDETYTENINPSIGCNVAIYPYSSNLLLNTKGSSELKITGVKLPAEQKYLENSFSNGSFPMIAVTETLEDHNLKFKNILGAINLQFKGNLVVKSIKIEGNANEVLSGTAIITTGSNNLSPVITMKGYDDVSKAVILNCPNGIQLKETEGTSFIITLPPTDFINGFTVYVTDVTDQCFTVSTNHKNEVLRSTILTMPIITIGTPANDNEDDESITTVQEIFISYPSRENYNYDTYDNISLYIGDQLQFKATALPSEAVNRDLTWISSNESVIRVDQNGLITAHAKGMASVSVTSGDVKSQSINFVVYEYNKATVDYIDEYNINHGKGTAVGRTVWAPVNCGYHINNFPWGKLYQWGRKYGQGYSGYLYDVNGNLIENISDATEPDIKNGPVSESEGNHVDNANVFFFENSSNQWGWLDIPNEKIWNFGTEYDPIKADSDPCPAGWRVPTYQEIHEISLYSVPDTNEDGQNGLWCSYKEGKDAVFLPKAGARTPQCNAHHRGSDGFYYSSTLSSTTYYRRAYKLSLRYVSASTTDNWSNAEGMSVRCVQE